MRHAPVCWAALLVLAAFQVFAAEARVSLTASNADPKMFHTIDDYLADLSESQLPAAERAALYASVIENTTRDWLNANGDRYGMHERFLAPGVGVSAELHVLRDAATAKQAADQMLLGAQRSMEKNGRTLTAIAGLDDWYPGSRYLAIPGENGPTGNLFVVLHDTHVYMLLMVGAGGYADATNTRAFLEPKLERILNFAPAHVASGTVDPRAAADTKRSVDAATTSIAMAFYDGLGFLLLYGVGILVNMLAGRRVLAPGWMGVLGLCIAASVWGVLFWRVAQEVALQGRALTPEQEGQMIGEVITPVLIVLALYGVLGGIRRGVASTASRTHG